MTLIPEPHKDTTRKDKYRPISVICAHTCMHVRKHRHTHTHTFFILKKPHLITILTSRIKEHLKRIRHHDQVGLIPRMQGWFNIYKSINVIHPINRKKIKGHMIISIDAKKKEFEKHPSMVKILTNSERIKVCPL